MKKNSFVLYGEYLTYFNRLELLEKGKLIDALLKYSQGLPVEDEIKTMESATEMAFLFISHQIDLDMEKWQSRCEINKQNGAKGGAPKGNSNAKKSSNEDEDEPVKNNRKQPKTTENKPNDNENDNENDSKKKKTKKKTSATEETSEVLTDKDINELIEKNFIDPDVIKKFKEFIAMRKAKGQSKAVRTRATFDGLIKGLREYAKTKSQALKILQKAITNCWQEFYPLKSVDTEEEGIPYAN
jgi:hypothetical protein